MSSQRLDSLAAVYAEALAEAAEARGGEALLREVGEALDAWGKVWTERRDVRAYFLSSFTPRTRRDETLSRWISGGPDLFQDFVRLLIRRGRGRHLCPA